MNVDEPEVVLLMCMLREQADLMRQLASSLETKARLIEHKLARQNEALYFDKRDGFTTSFIEPPSQPYYVRIKNRPDLE